MQPLSATVLETVAELAAEAAAAENRGDENRQLLVFNEVEAEDEEVEVAWDD